MKNEIVLRELLNELPTEIIIKVITEYITNIEMKITLIRAFENNITQSEFNHMLNNTIEFYTYSIRIGEFSCKNVPVRFNFNKQIHHLYSNGFKHIHKNIEELSIDDNRIYNGSFAEMTSLKELSISQEQYQKIDKLPDSLEVLRIHGEFGWNAKYEDFIHDIIIDSPLKKFVCDIDKYCLNYLDVQADEICINGVKSLSKRTTDNVIKYTGAVACWSKLTHGIFQKHYSNIKLSRFPNIKSFECVSKNWYKNYKYKCDNDDINNETNVLFDNSNTIDKITIQWDVFDEHCKNGTIKYDSIDWDCEEEMTTSWSNLIQFGNVYGAIINNKIKINELIIYIEYFAIHSFFLLTKNLNSASV